MRRTTLLVLLSASLLTAPASSLDRLWSFLASAWAPESVDQPAPTTDAGCGLDPSGRPACQQGS
jgi:hypothetical protein